MLMKNYQEHFVWKIDEESFLQNLPFGMLRTFVITQHGLESFVNPYPEPNVIKLFTAVIYEFSL
jgi:hypothetical protein